MSRNPKFGKDPYTICHWDTFDGTTFLVAGAKTLTEAEEKVKKKYEGKISPTGADRVEIVDKDGNVVKRYSVE